MIMRKCVFSWRTFSALRFSALPFSALPFSALALRAIAFAALATVATACAPSSPPATSASEPPVEPLVIGKSPSPPMPIATSDAPAAPPPADDAPVAATSALAVPARDPRLRRARSPGLLVAELQGLESLFAATQSTSPDRPAVARRLADDYAELARSGNPQTVSSAHASALKYYELLTTVPQYPQMDEAFYYAALEHELAGNMSAARRSYYELIKRSPQSKLIPLAYFAFGEMFNTEAMTDPSKNDLAIQAYAEARKYPAPGNPIYADALRRIAEVKARANGSSGGSVTRP